MYEQKTNNLRALNIYVYPFRFNIIVISKIKLKYSKIHSSVYLLYQPGKNNIKRDVIVDKHTLFSNLKPVSRVYRAVSYICSLISRLASCSSTLWKKAIAAGEFRSLDSLAINDSSDSNTVHLCEIRLGSKFPTTI